MESDADRIAQYLYHPNGTAIDPKPPQLTPPTPIVPQVQEPEEVVDINKLLAETVADARLLVGEAGYPHHYLSDPEQQLRMAICEMYAPEIEFTDAILAQCDKVFKWITTGETPSTQKPVTRLGVAK